MKKTLPLAFFLFVSLALISQVTVEGVITTASDGETLPGATILEKGTTNGTVTDIDGYYQLTVSEGATLVYQFVGMVKQEILVKGQTTINVALESEAFGLDEVVVIGFGTVKKRDLTGSVSTVGTKTIENLKPQKVEQALQGTVTGVNVTQQSGSPGSGLDIRIRGISTNGDASPVVIIDGYQGDISTLNPDDIETITVLKDAQAAIYGTVGANGIVLVTTKTGKRNTPTSFTFNSNFGLQQTTRQLPVLNATEYALILNESYAANGEDLPYPDVSGLGVGTDWQNEIFVTAPIFDNNFSITGGSDKVYYTLSASNLNQDGIISTNKSKFNRTTARMSLGADITSWLEFNSTLTYTSLYRSTFNDFGLGSVLFNSVNLPATVPVYDANGELMLAPANVGIEIINPLAQLANTYNDYNLSKWNGNFSLTAKFAKHWSATARVGFNTAKDDSKAFFPIVDYGGKVFDVTRSSVNQTKNNFNDYTGDIFVTYTNTWNESHNFTGTLGSTIFRTWGDNLSATGFDIPNNSWDFADISLANGLPNTKAAGSYVYDQRLLSFFLRGQYDFKGKYLASVMLRRDASSKFGPDNAAAWFPSATLGWVISDESFMDNADKVDQLKVRLSYGILGSDKIGDFQYLSQLNGEATYVLGGTIINGQAVGAVPNEGIKWEESEQFDIGVDTKFFGDKLDIVFDYFNRTTRNLLIGNIPVSGYLGVGAPGAAGPTVNAGTVRNWGYEVAIGVRGGNSEKFSYRIDFNFTALNNEVTEVNNGTGFVEGGGFGVGQPLPARMEVGQPIGYFFGFKTDGIFQTAQEIDAHPTQIALGAEAQPGDIKYVDNNGDGVINADDRTYIGDPIPDFLMGLNISFTFLKNFDFLAFFYSSIGNDIVRNYERAQPNVNRLAYVLDRWTGPGTSNEVPRVTTAATSNNVFSEFYVEDGSYVRLRRLQLGYTIPTENSKVKKVRFFLAADNLFTLTRYMGYDPTQSSGAPIGAGFDAGFYPAARVYWFGFSFAI